MENANLFFSKTQLNIINEYKKIHKFVFKYGYFVLAFLLSLGGCFLFIQKDITKQFPLRTTNIQNIQKLSEQYNQKTQATIKNEKRKNLIINGFFTEDENAIYSFSNLIDYNGFILPRIFIKNKQQELLPRENYENSNLNKETILSFINLFIQNPVKKRDTFGENTNEQLTLNEGIIPDFQILCLFQPKIIGNICESNMQDFFKNFTTYKLENDYTTLNRIYEKIKKKKKEKTEFCETLKKYSLYAKDTHEEIKTILRKCDEELGQFIDTYSSFLEVEQEIDGGFISSNTYRDKRINTYKLLSVQQLISKNIKNNTIDRSLITSYFTFLQDLLKQSEENQIDQLYKEMTYRFNNETILPYIETTKNLKLTKQDSILIEEQIQLINNGDSIFGIEGLVNQIKTKPEKKEDPENGDTQQKLITIEDLIQNLYNNPSLTILTSGILDGKKATITAMLKLKVIDTKNDNKIKNINVNSIMYVSQKDVSLILNTIQIEGQDSLTTYLNELLKSSPMGIPATIKHIEQKYSLFEQMNIPTTDICTQIKETIEEFQFESCDNTKIDGYFNKVNYVFSLQDEKLTNFILSDKTLEDEIKNSIGNTLITTSNTPSLILNIIRFEKAKDMSKELDLSKKIAITERFSKYLNTRADEIKTTQKEEEYRISFIIQGVNFIGTYTSEDQKLKNISFVVFNPKQTTEILSTLLIRDLEFKLNEEGKKDASSFIYNPLAYIKNWNQAAHDKYLKLVEEAKKLRE